jgi:hypothetical protein
MLFSVYCTVGRIISNKEKVANSLLLVYTEDSHFTVARRRDRDPTRCLHETVVTDNEEQAWLQFRHLPPSLTFTFKHDSFHTHREIDNC